MIGYIIIIYTYMCVEREKNIKSFNVHLLKLDSSVV